jgi:hypothetical protein
VIYQIEGEPETLLKPGDVFYEPAGVRIARFDAKEDGVTFFGYFLLGTGVNAELVFPESDNPANPGVQDLFDAVRYHGV